MPALGHALRSEFPVFEAYPSLAYLDNAATTQKPRHVIEGLGEHYRSSHANIHRGIYHLANKATAAYEGTRDQVAAWLHAAAREEIIFTKGSTESINLVANGFLRPRLQPGDEVILSTMEHHANLVPWQVACQVTGAKLRVIPINEAGELDLAAFGRLLNPAVKLVAVVHVSNTLGTINPVEEIIAQAHAAGIPVLVDAAQSAAHYPLDVQAMDCDFLVFSGHKLYGPTGIGVLYGKRQWLEAMEPSQYGGDMIRTVSFEATTYAGLPHRLEAGTPNVAGVAGLGLALDFLGQFAPAAVAAHLNDLGEYARQQLGQLPGLRIIGQAQRRSAIVSFTLEGVHPHDIATLLDHDDLALRAGHHCTQPLMDHYGLLGTARVSFGLYNHRAEIDRLVASLRQVQAMFA
jgi:cysteine desulfurase/selenocysteine lyase